MGRKGDAIWEFDDSIKIKMPAVKNPLVDVDGFECGNCGFRMRTTSVPRILAHHTACPMTCSLHQVAKPCNKAKTTEEKIAKYKAMLAEKTTTQKLMTTPKQPKHNNNQTIEKR